MKSSTKKMLKSVSKKDYVLAGNDYTKVDPHYIVLYTNVRKVVRVNAVNEETAIERALAREIDKNTWKHMGYQYIDTDYDMVEEKDYEAHKHINKEVRGGGN